MVLLQLVAVAAGAFWAVAGIVLLARGPGRRRRVLGGVAVVVGAAVLAAVALWILAQMPLAAPRPRGTGFPPLP